MPFGCRVVPLGVLLRLVEYLFRRLDRLCCSPLLAAIGAEIALLSSYCTWKTSGKWCTSR
jgi:hypothetical protein